MTDSNERSSRVEKVASVLRPLGEDPYRENRQFSLGISWACIGRRCIGCGGGYWETLSQAPSLLDRRGPSPGGGRSEDNVDKVIDEVVHVWLPKQRQLAHPATDLVLEVTQMCARWTPVAESNDDRPAMGEAP